MIPQSLSARGPRKIRKNHSTQGVKCCKIVENQRRRLMHKSIVRALRKLKFEKARFVNRDNRDNLRLKGFLFRGGDHYIISDVGFI